MRVHEFGQVESRAPPVDSWAHTPLEMGHTASPTQGIAVRSCGLLVVSEFGFGACDPTTGPQGGHQGVGAKSAAGGTAGGATAEDGQQTHCRQEADVRCGGDGTLVVCFSSPLGSSNCFLTHQPPALHPSFVHCKPPTAQVTAREETIQTMKDAADKRNKDLSMLMDSVKVLRAEGKGQANDEVRIRPSFATAAPTSSLGSHY